MPSKEGAVKADTSDVCAGSERDLLDVIQKLTESLVLMRWKWGKCVEMGQVEAVCVTGARQMPVVPHVSGRFELKKTYSSPHKAPIFFFFFSAFSDYI